MSAGFRVAGEVFWGTNGAVEAYLDALAAEAAAQYGATDPLAAFLRAEREPFWMGKVVDLDAALGDAAARGRFRAVLDAATEQLLAAGAFTDSGREWVAAVVGGLRRKIAGTGEGGLHE